MEWGLQDRKGVKVEGGGLPSQLPHLPPCPVSIPRRPQPQGGPRLSKRTSFMNLIHHKGDMG